MGPDVQHSSTTSVPRWPAGERATSPHPVLPQAGGVRNAPGCDQWAYGERHLEAAKAGRATRLRLTARSRSKRDYGVDFNGAHRALDFAPQRLPPSARRLAASYGCMQRESSVPPENSMGLPERPELVRAAGLETSDHGTRSAAKAPSSDSEYLGPPMLHVPIAPIGPSMLLPTNFPRMDRMPLQRVEVRLKFE